MSENIIVHLFDGKTSEDVKAKYIPHDGIAEARIKTGILTRTVHRFDIYSEHVWIQKKKTRRGKIIGVQHVLVDKNTYQSIPIKLPNPNSNGDDDLSPEIRRDKISNLTRLAYLKSIQSPKKLDRWLTLIIMFSGYGLFRLIEWVLTAIFSGVH